MKTDIPQWVHEYNAKNYQSSAGKALRIVLDSKKEDDKVFASLVNLAKRVSDSDSWILDLLPDIDKFTILKFLEEQKQNT